MERFKAFRIFNDDGVTRGRVVDATLDEVSDGKVVIKRELLPDGREKLIVKDPGTGDFTDLVIAGD